MTKKVKCLVVYENGTFIVKEIKTSLESFYKTIGCNLISIVNLGGGIDVMFDDEGKFDTNNLANPIFQPLYPNDLMVGTLILFKQDEKGGFKNLLDEDITMIINFFTRHNYKLPYDVDEWLEKCIEND